MKLSYYPGCTLKTKAKSLEKSALAALDALGVEYQELERWNCCGAVYSLADDDLIHLVAPVRDLIRVQQQGNDTVLTLCSMCYNTLARANELMKNDEEKRNTINTFMDEEPDYTGEVKVLHFLDFIRDVYGWDKLKEKVTSPLAGLKVAPYYGCTLVRPAEVALDGRDTPQIFHEFMETLGAEVIDFPLAAECCGSYQVLGNPDAALHIAGKIINGATDNGAEAMVLTCPLCEFNLSNRQTQMKEKFDNMTELPVFYFSQLLALALGVSPEICHLEMNRPIAMELLKTKNIVKEVTA